MNELYKFKGNRYITWCVDEYLAKWNKATLKKN